MMQKIDSIYDRLPYPTEQFYSCIGGRLLCAFRYFQKDQTSLELFPFLLLCKLKATSLLEGGQIKGRFLEDPSYFRAVELTTPDGEKIFSLEGIPFLNKYLEKYSMTFRAQREIPANSLMEQVRREFELGHVVILGIDQYYHTKSEKYHKQKNAYHALLIKGIQDSRECVIASDSLYHHEYEISYEDLQRMSIGTMYTVACEEAEPAKTADMPMIFLKLQGQYNMQSVLDFCFAEMKMCFATYQGDILKWILYGYVHNLKYVLLPYLKARKYLFQGLGRNMQGVGKLLELCEESQALWDRFLVLLIRSANTGNGVDKLTQRINAIIELETIIQSGILSEKLSV